MFNNYFNLMLYKQVENHRFIRICRTGFYLWPCKHVGPNPRQSDIHSFSYRKTFRFNSFHCINADKGSRRLLTQEKLCEPYTWLWKQLHVSRSKQRQNVPPFGTFGTNKTQIIVPQNCHSIIHNSSQYTPVAVPSKFGLPLLINRKFNVSVATSRNKEINNAPDINLEGQLNENETRKGKTSKRKSLSDVNLIDSPAKRLLKNHQTTRIELRPVDDDYPVIPFNIRGFDEKLFETLCEPDSGKVSVPKFLNALSETGLQQSDPRLHQCITNLYEIKKSRPDGNERDLLDKETFIHVIKDNIGLITRAFRSEFIIPEFLKFSGIIEKIFHNCKSNIDGKVATYIPQLSRCDPSLWGVSVCTIDGQRENFGDFEVPFCLQSCSKPLSYALALDEHGPGILHQYVGQEPSGHGFNEIKLDVNSKPHNPMINAGAMVVLSLLKSGLPLADRFDYVSKMYRKLAGGEYLGFNNSVFLSERETADRNFSLGYYLREHRCFPEGVNLIETLDFYFQLCSVDITCESGAVIAATLANGGICPLSGEQVVNSAAVRDTLSLMHSCGMYDYSGQFAFKVGLPGKSGVSGCILLVIPNVMGICCYAPPLDATGNSCRGKQFAEELVQVFNFHHYDNLRHSVRKVDPRRHRIDKEGSQVMNLLFAAYSGDIDSLRRLYLAGMNMNMKDYDNRTALHLCAAEGHLDCTRFLVEKCKVSLNVPDRWNQTPLDEAKNSKHEILSQYLEQHMDK